jgi:hypothetical protein
VFGQPAFVAGHRRSDAQRQALFAEQGIAAVAGAIRPDFAGFGIMDYGLTADVRLARPRHVFLTGGQRRADRMHAGDEEAVAAQRVEHFLTHAGHDAHVDDHVSRVGDFDADLGNRAANRPHAERNHIHGAAAHTAFELLIKLGAHFGRRCPIVGRASIFLFFRADEGAVFDARHIGRMGAGQIGIGALGLVQLGERASGHHFVTQLLVFRVRAVAPLNTVGLGQGSDFIYPLQ